MRIRNPLGRKSISDSTWKKVVSSIATLIIISFLLFIVVSFVSVAVFGNSFSINRNESSSLADDFVKSLVMDQANEQTSEEILDFVPNSYVRLAADTDLGREKIFDVGEQFNYVLKSEKTNRHLYVIVSATKFPWQKEASVGVLRFEQDETGLSEPAQSEAIENGYINDECLSDTPLKDINENTKRLQEADLYACRKINNL